MLTWQPYDVKPIQTDSLEIVFENLIQLRLISLELNHLFYRFTLNFSYFTCYLTNTLIAIAVGIISQICWLVNTIAH